MMVDYYYITGESISKEGRKYTTCDSASTINKARANSIKSFAKYRFPIIPVTKGSILKDTIGCVVKTNDKRYPYVWETYRRFGGIDKRYVLNKNGTLGKRLV